MSKISLFRSDVAALLVGAPGRVANADRFFVTHPDAHQLMTAEEAAEQISAINY